MDTNRILHRDFPVMTGFFIPETEGRISARRVARIFFQSQEDRDSFYEIAKQEYPEFVCSPISLDDESVIVRASGIHNIMNIFRSIYGWEAVDNRLRFQSC